MDGDQEKQGGSDSQIVSHFSWVIVVFWDDCGRS